MQRARFMHRVASNSSNGSLAIGKRWKSTFGVAIDIDGVLYRGQELCPNAVAVVKTLRARNIPTMFLTNGGGHTEGQRAKLLSKRLMGEVDITPEQVFLAHTPLKFMDELKEKHIVVLGRNSSAVGVLENYGYKNAISVQDFHMQHPYLFPDIKEYETVEGEELPEAQPKVDAIVGIMNPEAWDRDLQLCCDILRSDGQVGTLSKEQTVPIYMSCPDFEYVTEHAVPRFGAGVFPLILRRIFKKLTGRKLDLTMFGKPHRATYDLAEQQMDRLANNLGYDEGVTAIYAIGDNPKSDVKGANNASDRWTSVLVRTGVFIGDGNDEKNPADKVVDDVGEALTYIFSENMGSYEDNDEATA